MWVVPLGLLVLMIGAGHGLLMLDERVDVGSVGMAGASIEGARGMLQAVASSMVTVAGVVFSLTLLVLSQASSQYSPRVLRNFLRDRVTQSVLGIFLGVYAYCLVVLRGMGGDTADMPVLAILGGLAAALVSVVYLIYFFHHLAESLQLENILGEIEAETLPVVARLYPHGAGVPDDEDSERDEQPSTLTFTVAANRPGYIQDIELASLMKIAERLDAIIYIPRCVGEFVVQGKPLAFVAAESAPGTELIDKVDDAFSLGLTRSIQQDAAFGIRQMVDVAMKALSPGVNDTTNAIMVLDRISVIMIELTARHFPHRRRLLDDKLRLVVARPSFESLLGLSFDQIRHWGGQNPAVLGRLLEVLGDMLAVSPTNRRRALIQAYAQRVLAAAERGIDEDGDLAWIRGRYKRCVDSPRGGYVYRSQT